MKRAERRGSEGAKVVHGGGGEEGEGGGGGGGGRVNDTRNAEISKCVL